MLILDATNKSIELQASVAGTLPYVCSYVDITTTTLVPASSDGSITNTSATAIIAAPAASTQRQVKLINVRNAGTVANTVTVQLDVGGTDRTLISFALQPGDVLEYLDGFGWSVMDVAGRAKAVTSMSAGLTGFPYEFYKIGTAAEAAGIRYCFSKDTGAPGAWAVGTPGLNGRATDGNSAGDAGCITFPDPSSGAMYLTSFLANSSLTSQLSFMDLLWVNTGIVVTTTTNQAITPAALPARDANGTANGALVQAGLLVTATTGNGSPITNTTISYTNQDGTSGRTGTMASFPATALVGSLIPFQLQAGDTGVRSVEGITLGTSYVSGSVSLVLYRTLAAAAIMVNNMPGEAKIDPAVGVRCYNDTCGMLVTIAPGTTAQNIGGVLTFSNR